MLSSRDLSVSVEASSIAAALELLAGRESEASNYGLAFILDCLAKRAHGLALELDEGGWIKPEFSTSDPCGGNQEEAAHA